MAFVYISFLMFHHGRIEIDTSISVIVVSPATWEAHYNDLNLGINSYTTSISIPHTVTAIRRRIPNYEGTGRFLTCKPLDLVWSGPVARLICYIIWIMRHYDCSRICMVVLKVPIWHQDTINHHNDVDFSAPACQGSALLTLNAFNRKLLTECLIMID